VKRLALLALLASSVASAQDAPPLAQIRDPKALASTLAAITQDPAIPVDDPNARTLAQALMTEGVKQLQDKAYDQALANFLEAYAKLPSPKILLNIASTLRDMGRYADAANTYQRYLLDPTTSAERVGEVKELLLALDGKLTILTVRVTPRGSNVSIDAGPYVPVGSTLQTRVRPGIHLVRVQHDGAENEVSINGFDGENKEVTAAVTSAAPPKVEAEAPAAPAAPLALKAPPEDVNGWLIDGKRYGGDGVSNERRARAEFGGPDIAPIVPTYAGDVSLVGVRPQPREEHISSGVIALARIDGKGRGAAFGPGIVLARDHFELELIYLRSKENGAYLGGRYRAFTGFFRPYLGLGVPAFIYDHDNDDMTTSTKLSVGVRAALGLELVINGHLSITGDVGYEHFFSVDEHFESDVFAPTVGVIGRL
jgi:hypothetical protein